jgi:predicted RNase H-like HicB family nuclease
VIAFDRSSNNYYDLQGSQRAFKGREDMTSYTAKYTKIESGYMGQLVEWPEVVTEGRDLEECRTMLRDALNEVVLAYEQLGKEIPNEIQIAF